MRAKSGWATAVLGARAGDAKQIERRLCSIVERVTRKSVATLIADYRAAGCVVRRVALVVGSQIDPARIANDHIRAQALAGPAQAHGHRARPRARRSVARR